MCEGRLCNVLFFVIIAVDADDAFGSEVRMSC